MINIRKEPIHCRQEQQKSCGAACFAMLFNIDEAVAREICWTSKTGTPTYRVADAIKENTNAKCNLIQINQDYAELFWLPMLSQRFPLYLSCDFINQGKRGRPRTNRHAIVAAKGLFFDPGEMRECPIESYENRYNKKLIINAIILIDYELPGWQDRLKE